MVDPKICPFCKKENGCEADIPNNDCWCNHIKVPLELRELISPKLKMKACICRNCVILFKKDKELFLKKYSKLT
ncbi:cysteine-rich CWC family protein [Campylobacterota bacterium DY0563]